MSKKNCYNQIIYLIVCVILGGVKLAGVVDVGGLPNGNGLIVVVFCALAANVKGCDVDEVPNIVHGCDALAEENVDVGLNIVEAIVVVTGGLPVKVNMISMYRRNCNYICQ